MTLRSLAVAVLCALALLPRAPAFAQNSEPPLLQDAVKSGKLPPMSERLPKLPLAGDFDGRSRRQVRRRPAHADGEGPRHPHDGRLRLRAARRLRREAAFRSGPGSRASRTSATANSRSSCDPATAGRTAPRSPSEDFRYYWEDVANNKTLSPLGLPMALLVNGKPPRVTFPDPTTIKYAWDEPNPLFLPALAGAVAALPVPPCALPQAIPCEVHRRGQGEGAGVRGEDAQLGRAAPQEGRAVPVRQSGPAHARAVDQHHAAADDALRAAAQPVLPPRRPRRPATAVHRPRHHQPR